jgi:hypothetical protein
MFRFASGAESWIETEVGKGLNIWNLSSSSRSLTVII